MAKIWVEAYGCSASYADSEIISGLVINGGHTIARNPSESDLNVVVTCSVKDATANKMIHRIKKLKTKPLVVAGCMPKTERATIEKFSPNASLMGPNSLGRSMKVINSTLKGGRLVVLGEDNHSKIALPKVRLNPIVGIVQIASGCMSECTFCQTKLSKGDLFSYRIGEVIRQVKSEIEDGCKEVWLTSTDNGCYGLDIGEDLPTLIDSVFEIPGNFKIRVGMMNPMYMPRIREGLLKSFENEKVFKFLHIPVQSGSDKVLKEMKRGHTSSTFRDTVAQFRKKFPKFTFSTDIIVGFPTENEQDFLQTVKILKETKPDIVNLSRYSKRPGTKAAKLNQIDVQKIKHRSKVIYELSNDISLKNNKKWVGWKGEALFDEKLEEGIIGRNFAYKPIFVNEKVKIGQTYQVKITEATTHNLIGTIVS